MLGLTDLEVYNSFFNIANEINKFELSRSTKNWSCFSLEELKTNVEKFYLGDLTDELSRAVVTNKLKK